MFIQIKLKIYLFYFCQIFIPVTVLLFSLIPYSYPAGLNNYHIFKVFTLFLFYIFSIYVIDISEFRNSAVLACNKHFALLNYFRLRLYLSENQYISEKKSEQLYKKYIRLGKLLGKQALINYNFISNFNKLVKITSGNVVFIKLIIHKECLFFPIIFCINCLILFQILYLRFYEKNLFQSLTNFYIKLQNKGISDYEFKQHLSELNEMYNYKTIIVKEGSNIHSEYLFLSLKLDHCCITFEKENKLDPNEYQIIYKGKIFEQQSITNITQLETSIKKVYIQNFKITSEIKDLEQKYNYIFRRRLDLWKIHDCIENLQLNYSYSILV